MRPASSVILLCVLLSYPGNVHGQCDGSQPLALSATEFPGYLTSPGYDGTADYAPDLSCSWLITSAVADQQLVLNIGPFEVDTSSDANCNKDFIDIFDGADNEAAQIAHMCRRNVSQGEEIGPYVSTGDTFFVMFVSDRDNKFGYGFNILYFSVTPADNEAAQITHMCRRNVTQSEEIGPYVSTGDTFFVMFVSDSDTDLGYGFNILYFSVTPASQPDCGGPPITVTTSAQVLMSPTLPDKYTAGLSCEWLFSVATGILLFKVKFADIEPSNGGTCPYDGVKIYDGDTSDTVLLEICQLGEVELDTSEVNTTNNGATVKFISDGSKHYYGFMLTVEAVEETTTTTTTTAAPVAVTTCSSTGEAVSASITQGTLQSPNYGTAYDTNMLCKWIIQAEASSFAVEVQFDTTGGFGIEDSTYCSYDYVSLYDGDSTTSTLINTFCGTTVTSSTYRSSGTSMLVVFSTDYSINKIGFKLKYIAALNTPASCDASYTRITANYDTTGGINSITSPSHPSNYASDLEVYWVVTNSDTAQYKIILNFTALEIEQATGCIYDRVTIYDGSCIKDSTLYLICGTTLNWYELTGSAHLIHFHTDGSVNKAGFSLQYYVVNVATTLAVITTTTTLGPPVEAVIETMNEVLTNYSKDLLPSRDLSAPIQASMNFHLVAINGLDSVDQKLTTTGQFDVVWTDQFLSWPPPKKFNIVRMLIPQDDLWRPDIALMNGFTTISAMGASFMFIDVLYNGTCTWRPYQILESACQVDMTYYPYDTQICALQFGMWSSSDSDVVTKLGENGLQIHPSFQQNSEWELVTTRTEITTSNSQQTVNFYLTLQRNPAYVTFYMTLPVVMLAYISTFTFAIPCESGEKSGFAITVFLSFTVFVVVIQGSIPDNSDSVSLFGAYVITVTIMSAVAMMVTLLELRAVTLNAEIYPVAKRVKRFVKFISNIRGKMSCTKQKKAEDTVKLISTPDKDDVSLMSVKSEASVNGKRSEYKKHVTFGRTDTVDSIMFPKHKNLTIKREVTTSSISVIKEDTKYFDRSKTPKETEVPEHTNNGRKESLISFNGTENHESAGTLKLHRQVTTASITLMKENTLIYDNGDVKNTALLESVIGPPSGNSQPPTSTVLLNDLQQSASINDDASQSGAPSNDNQVISSGNPEAQSPSVQNIEDGSQSNINDDGQNPEATIEQIPGYGETTDQSTEVTENQATSTDVPDNKPTSTDTTESQATPTNVTGSQATPTNVTGSQATSSDALENQTTSIDVPDHKATSTDITESQTTPTEIHDNTTMSTDATERQANSTDTNENQAMSTYPTENKTISAYATENQATSTNAPEKRAPQHDSKENFDRTSNSSNNKSEKSNSNSSKTDDTESEPAEEDNPWKELVATVDFVFFFLFLLLTTLFTLTFLLKLKYN